MKTTEKSLTEYLVAADGEYDVTIKSIKNIHDPIVYGNVERVMGRFFLRSIEKGKATALKNDDDFPSAGLVRVYEVKCVIAVYHDPEKIADQVSLETGVPLDRIVVTVSPEPKSDEDSEPTVVLGSEYEKVDHQDTVGPKRVTTILASLKKENADRRAAQAEKLKKVVVDHLGIKETLGENVRKGFYEARITESGLVVESGPFDKKPANGDYLSSYTLIEKRLAKLREYDDTEPSERRETPKVSLYMFLKSAGYEMAEKPSYFSHLPGVPSSVIREFEETYGALPTYSGEEMGPGWNEDLALDKSGPLSTVIGGTDAFGDEILVTLVDSRRKGGTRTFVCVSGGNVTYYRMWAEVF